MSARGVAVWMAFFAGCGGEPPPVEHTDSGKACARNADCASGLCLPLANGNSVCTNRCDDPSGCPSGWTCGSLDGVAGKLCKCAPATEICNGTDDDCDGQSDEQPAADADCHVQQGPLSSCQAGTCVCPGLSCGGRCYDGSTDAAHCGSCQTMCAKGAICANGACACPGDHTMVCGGQCVEVWSNGAHCGRCNEVCPMSASCQAGVCTCPQQAPDVCASICVNTRTDVANCGKCGVTCAKGQFCNFGVCVCNGGQVVCGGQCVDTQSSPVHCGACNAPCNANGAACTMGTCQCKQNGFTICSNACVDLSSNNSHCGGCGMVCNAAGATCTMGACRCMNPMLTICTNACLDTATNPSHCGACGTICPAAPNAAPVCVAGKCGYACAAGYADCDGNAGNGCELDARNDPLNCGACGRACVYSACMNAECKPVALATGEADPSSLALDANSVYWSNSNDNPGLHPKSIVRVDKAGGNLTVLVVDNGSPTSLVLAGGALYWQSTTGLVNAAVGLMTATTGGANLAAVRVAPNGSRLLATDGTTLFSFDKTPNNGPYALMGTPVGGGNPTVLAGALQNPFNLVASPIGAYYAENGSQLVIYDTLNKQLIPTVEQSCQPLAADGGHIFASRAGGLDRIDLDGKNPFRLFTGSSVLAAAIDANYVYFTNTTNHHQISRVSKAGGPIVVLTSMPAPIVIATVAVDATNVYFATYQEGGMMWLGSVYKVAK